MYFNTKDFGKRLQLARKTAGLTQQELADKVSVERKRISHLDCGERCCAIDLLADFSEVLGLSIDGLPIRCKVYYDLSPEDEAVLFAQQAGFSAKVYPSSKIRALVFAGDSLPAPQRYIFEVWNIYI